ncbi:MAG TPA: acetylxylan esterase [Verrucomicrobiota bacterium]|nr:acetylxylan esterase [Verrucomicrobiota bacterium]
MTLACVIAGATPAPETLAAQATTNYSLTVSTQRPDAIYRKGEEVVFNIRLAHQEQLVPEAEVQWTLSKDGVPPITTGTLKLSDGRGVISGKLNEPGFLQCRVTFAATDGSTRAAVAGAGVAPLRIKPSLPVPRDFDAFWFAQKRKLVPVPINAKLAQVESREAGVEAFDLQADCVGAPVSGYYARPAAARARSLPIILTVHGAGVRSANLAGTVGWAKQGFLALDINAHGIPNGKPDQFYQDLASGELKEYRTQGRESRDTIYFLGMFLRLVRAIDFLTAQPEWDGRALIVHGSSQGGAQSIVAAGLDSRVTFLAAGVPAMCDHTGAVAGRASGWPKLVPNGADGKPEARALEAARYYDAMNFARRTKSSESVRQRFC